VLAKNSNTDYDTEWVDAATGGGGASWGAITGTLTDQADLDAALDGKSDTGHTHTASQISDFNTAADARVTAGIAGKLDKSASVTAIVAITRTAYDALGTPDATTLYIIDEAS
jgi:hypothetical protein